MEEPVAHMLFVCMCACVFLKIAQVALPIQLLCLSKPRLECLKLLYNSVCVRA